MTVPDDISGFEIIFHMPMNITSGENFCSYNRLYENQCVELLVRVLTLLGALWSRSHLTPRIQISIVKQPLVQGSRD